MCAQSQSVDGGDFDYYRATFGDFGDVMDRASAGLLELGGALVAQQYGMQRGGASAPAIASSTVIDEYTTVVDVIDGILEAAVRRALLSAQVAVISL